MQLEILPLELISFDPPDINSADAEGYGTASDGMVYAVKSQNKGTNLPATEWISTHLADCVGIAVPPCRQLKKPDGTYAFGSRWEGGVKKPEETIKILTNQIAAVTEIAKLIPSIYVYDLFMHNVDRHKGNYLARQAHHNTVLMAFDFSRAFLHHGWPLPKLPLDQNCNTQSTIRELKNHHTFDFSAAHNILDKLENLNPDTLPGIIDQMPEAWLDARIKSNLISWWRNSDYIERIEYIREGIKNGTLI